MIVHDEMHEVRLHGWREGALKVTATKTIQAHTKFGLAQAKEAVDRCLEGKITVFTFDSVEPALGFSNAINEIGFISEVFKSDTGDLVS